MSGVAKPPPTVPPPIIDATKAEAPGEDAPEAPKTGGSLSSRSTMTDKVVEDKYHAETVIYAHSCSGEGQCLEWRGPCITYLVQYSMLQYLHIISVTYDCVQSPTSIIT